mgnify:CR=1 FL=1
MKKFLLLIMVLALVSACGTTVNIKPEGAVSDSDSAKKLPKLSFNSIAIEVRTEVEDCHEEVKMFEDFLAENFKQKNVKVVAPGSNAEAKMTIVIKHLEKVSKTSRWIWGSWAGSAELKANVAIITRDNNSVNFSIDANARASSILSGDRYTDYGGSTDDLLERTSKKITEEILL